MILKEARDVRFGSKADMCSARRHVRFTPESGHVQCNSACALPIADIHQLTRVIDGSLYVSLSKALAHRRAESRFTTVPWALAASLQRPYQRAFRTTHRASANHQRPWRSRRPVANGMVAANQSSVWARVGTLQSEHCGLTGSKSRSDFVCCVARGICAQRKASPCRGAYPIGFGGCFG